LPPFEHGAASVNLGSKQKFAAASGNGRKWHNPDSLAPPERWPLLDDKLACVSASCFAHLRCQTGVLARSQFAITSAQAMCSAPLTRQSRCRISRTPALGSKYLAAGRIAAAAQIT
jgi:hypothetical protein